MRGVEAPGPGDDGGQFDRHSRHYNQKLGFQDQDITREIVLLLPLLCISLRCHHSRDDSYDFTIPHVLSLRKKETELIILKHLSTLLIYNDCMIFLRNIKLLKQIKRIKHYCYI